MPLAGGLCVGIRVKSLGFRIVVIRVHGLREWTVEEDAKIPDPPPHAPVCHPLTHRRSMGVGGG